MNDLSRRLSLVHIICIASGALISSGLFVLPGIAHGRAGPAVIVSYLLAGILAAIGLLSVTELATAMPKAGGDYFFISRALGPGIGTVAGFLSWFSISLKAGFALVGIGALSELILPIDGRFAGGIFLAIFCITNLHGVRKAANLQVGLGVGLLILLAGFVVAGAGKVQVDNFTPFVPQGWSAVFSTAGFVFVAFGAAMKVASMAEEIRNPGRNIPLGIGLSIFIVTLLYVSVVGIATGVLPGDKLDFSRTPISEAAGSFLGKPGMAIMSIGALLAFLTTANAGIMTASRYLLALAEDNLAPDLLSRLRRKTGTPWVAVLVTSGLLLVALLLPLDLLVESASVVFVIIYILASLSIIILREGKIQNYRPVFHAPFYPYLQVIGITGFLFVLVEMGAEAFIVAGILVCAALSLYWFYGRKKRHAESALLHLIERITDKELITGNLEEELRDIIRKRDEIKTDQLDRIIKRSIILDFEKRMEAREFFRIAASRLAPLVKCGEQELFDRLCKREKEASTVLRPGVAVPHLLVEAEDTYEILVARSRDGISFPNQSEPVHAAFVLMTSYDNRNFHLKVMAGLAQMVQSTEFDEQWMNAADEDRLRDILLLEERMRIRTE